MGAGPHVEAVNVGGATPVAAKSGRTGIDKRPVDGPVRVEAPGPGGSGLAGDAIVDARHHGGGDKAVYAYAREDLDRWAATLGRVAPGTFGENLTLSGVDVTGARIGERWRVGRSLVLQVTLPRVPCATFSAHLGRERWIDTFTRAALPGAYLRVVEPGEVRAGDPVVVVQRPEHDVTVGLAFRALTGEPELLPRLLDAPELPGDLRENVSRRVGAG
ncbi:MOSC domain-containing protein [Pseudonocardia nematodicida]|uniref:MOSC domain-containing protein n=1 Tax=Pseudonocardia nematodicida TaxID=1206997 RepID=A0ABV1KD71_9PSEU